MSRGRPPAGPRLVDGLDGSDAAKERLRVVLQTIAGELSVVDACAVLNVSEARFHELRTELLQAAVTHFEPRPKGRPAQQPSPDAEQLAQLKAQNQQLRKDLRAAQIREEIALVMPHLLKHNQKPRDRRRRLDALQEQMEGEDDQKKEDSAAITCHTSTHSSDAKNSIPKSSA